MKRVWFVRKRSVSEAVERNLVRFDRSSLTGTAYDESSREGRVRSEFNDRQAVPGSIIPAPHVNPWHERMWRGGAVFGVRTVARHMAFIIHLPVFVSRWSNSGLGSNRGYGAVDAPCSVVYAELKFWKKVITDSHLLSR